MQANLLKVNCGVEIPIYVNGEPLFSATIDAEDLERVEKYRWQTTRTAFGGWPHSERLISGEKLPKKILLHKEVMQSSALDGRRNKIMPQDGNKLNCCKSNLVKYVAEKGTRRFFPKTTQNFINYVHSNDPGSPIDNLLKEAEIKRFSRKEVVLELEADTKIDRMRLQNALKEYLAEDFNFKGHVAIYVAKGPDKVTSVALKGMPEPIKPAPELPATHIQPAPAQPRSVDAGPFSLDVRAMGLVNLNANEPIIVEEFSAKLRQGKYRHIVSYRCEEIVENNIQ